MARVLDMPRSVAIGGAGSTGCTAETLGSGVFKTNIKVNTTLPAIAGGADLAVGKALFTFPDGVIRVMGAYMSLAVTQTEDNITNDTPDGGLGTTIASGVVAVLSGTAAFENILTGQTFNDCDGTAEVTHVATDLLIAAADSHTVYFNIADGWAADGDDAAVLSGEVSLIWAKM